ncbi:MAG: hypothetical protein ACR2NP_23120 [Pirellulaceae bacterium]
MIRVIRTPVIPSILYILSLSRNPGRTASDRSLDPFLLLPRYDEVGLETNAAEN